MPWPLLAVVALILAGGVLLAFNARQLGDAAAATEAGADALRAASRFQKIVPGAHFDVPAAAGVTLLAQPSGAVVIANRTRAEAPVLIDLCAQLADAAGRLMPVRLGGRWTETGRPAGRNAMLVKRGSTATVDMPEVRITGTIHAPLQLAWTGAAARWLGDGGDGIVGGSTGAATLRNEGWLAWQGGALQVLRRPSASCPRAGELVARLHVPDGAQRGRALVSAYAAHGASASAWLAAGDYAIPAVPSPELEDETLFDALRQHGLVRLLPDGAVVLAPADLAEWLAAPAQVRATSLDIWRGVRLDDEQRKLLRRLYRQADGTYVRQQVALYNSERTLLAWRQREGDASRWRVDGGTTSAMPPLAARLFASLPQGWQPWTRLAAPANTARLVLDLPAPAKGTERLSLLLAGRVAGSVEGAALQSAAACDGRACTAPDDVQRLVLAPQPGARRIVLAATPLDARAMERPADRDYRHLRVAAGRLVWQPLPRPAAGEAVRASPGPVLLADRNGTPLWSDGTATEAAQAAGLAPLLGLGPQHAASLAGMLARADSRGATARLSLDLPLQALAQEALDCLGLRHGRWRGGRCEGGATIPAGRKAGLVILDAENGDILAAAGAGQPHVGAGNWAEARDLDRANPAASALRLPALQHDGGANNSPGSTFKVISALGLELAAQEDRRLDALLDGQPLARINAEARERGFDFSTGAPTYPASARGAYVTNYREMGIDGRAQGGRLGLPQALAYSLNTWFAWTGELSDHTLLGRAEGGVPDLQPLEPGALDAARPILAAARRLGFERNLRLDGGLLPADFRWADYDVLQATPARIDPVHTRHELRQMSIGLRMQATPLQMAMAAAALGQGASVAPRLLLALDGRDAKSPAPVKLDARLDRIRAGMQGVIERGTAAGAFRSLPAHVRAGLYGKTGTAPVSDDRATVWFTGWLEPGTLPGQRHGLAFATYVSRSEGTGGEHAAPVIAAVLARLADGDARHKVKQTGK
ncbi:penicillin binding protein [Pseudoduganella lurida]|uniref:beta-lactamase n=2 Tax=Pseudoduganella lurida TaxID=1036180 RepID=A0A562RM90_9BURK|nr:penicillin binding protein [Pseudoduganella lurida]